MRRNDLGTLSMRLPITMILYTRQYQIHKQKNSSAFFGVLQSR
jgi:hypothetical protein